MQALLSTPRFRCYRSTDVVGAGVRGEAWRWAVGAEGGACGGTGAPRAAVEASVSKQRCRESEQRCGEITWSLLLQLHLRVAPVP